MIHPTSIRTVQIADTPTPNITTLLSCLKASITAKTTNRVLISNPIYMAIIRRLKPAMQMRLMFRVPIEIRGLPNRYQCRLEKFDILQLLLFPWYGIHGLVPIHGCISQAQHWVTFKSITLFPWYSIHGLVRIHGSISDDPSNITKIRSTCRRVAEYYFPLGIVKCRPTLRSVKSTKIKPYIGTRPTNTYHGNRE